ncbi:MAG: hypothetical protein UZ17_ACD001001567 [Acidobacteria bacterium OLB17]|nr:MAG: hypothetical protein UZ17_ACD001001567 [Acidobacteria bacterium OLB17]
MFEAFDADDRCELRIAERQSCIEVAFAYFGIRKLEDARIKVAANDVKAELFDANCKGPFTGGNIENAASSSGQQFFDAVIDAAVSHGHGFAVRGHRKRIGTMVPA